MPESLMNRQLLSYDDALSEFSMIFEHLFDIITTMRSWFRSHTRRRIDQTSVGFARRGIRMLTGLIGGAATVQFVLNRGVCLMANVIFVIGILIQDRQATRWNDDLWTRTTLTETTIGMPDKDLSAVRLEEHGTTRWRIVCLARHSRWEDREPTSGCECSPSVSVVESAWDWKSVSHVILEIYLDRHWFRGSFANWSFSARGSSHFWRSWPRATYRRFDDVWHWLNVRDVQCWSGCPKWYEDRSCHSSELELFDNLSPVHPVRSILISNHRMDSSFHRHQRSSYSLRISIEEIPNWNIRDHRRYWRSPCAYTPGSSRSSSVHPRRVEEI